MATTLESKSAAADPSVPVATSAATAVPSGTLGGAARSTSAAPPPPAVTAVATAEPKPDPNASDPAKRLALNTGGEQAFPRYVYSDDGRSAYVTSQEERDKLEGNWTDTPTKTAGYQEPKPQAPSSPPVEPSLADRQRQTMTTLGEGHTYRDRVEAQARSLGIAVTGEETLEWLMHVIRMKASS